MFWLVSRAVRYFTKDQKYPGTVGSPRLMRLAAIGDDDSPATHDKIDVAFGCLLCLVITLLSGTATMLVLLLVNSIALAPEVVNAGALLLLGPLPAVMVYRYGPGAYLSQFPPEDILSAKRGTFRYEGPASLLWGSNRWEHTFKLIRKGVSPKDFAILITCGDSSVVEETIKG